MLFLVFQPKDEKERLHPGVIAAIVLACVLLVAIIVLIVLWKVKVHPNTKTYGESISDGLPYLLMQPAPTHAYTHPNVSLCAQQCHDGVLAECRQTTVTYSIHTSATLKCKDRHRDSLFLNSYVDNS